MALTVDQFGKALVSAGLFTADELKALWTAIAADARPKQGDGFAKLLVQQGKLNQFQADELFSGRNTPLVMGDYVLVAELGAGGMGKVYKARHRRMERIVALKVMSAAAMQDEAAVKRFQREVKAAARLEHINIVTAYDSGEIGKVKYLVMQFVDGGDLSQLVKRQGPLEVEQAVDYVLQAARGLAFAHRKGVVHRDIKPANLLLDGDGVVKILDMGLARIEGGDGLTATEQVMGTVDYMSPEQAANTKTADGRSDIYSLGCTLWFLLTAKKVYDGDTMISRLMSHRTDPLPSLVKTRDDVPWSLEQAFHKMIAKSPEERFQTMDEVVAALEPFSPSGGSRPGMGSSIGMGPQNAELASFLKSVGPAVKPQTKPAPTGTKVDVEATAQFAAAGADTDPKSEILPRPKKATQPQTKGKEGDGKPPVKLIAGGIGGFALLVALGVWVLIRDKDGNEVARVQVPEGGTATVVTKAPPPPVAVPTTTSRSADLVSFFGGTPIALPSSAPGVPGTPIDLIARCDPARDTVKGTWIKQGTSLNSNGGSLKLFTPSPLPAEYDVDLEMELLKDDTNGGAFGFLMQGRQAVVVMDSVVASGANWGIAEIDKHAHTDPANPTFVSGPRLPLHQRTPVTIRVRRSGVQVSVNGKSVVDWHGEPNQLSTKYWTVDDPNTLFLRMFAQYNFHRITLTPLVAPPVPAVAAAPSPPRWPLVPSKPEDIVWLRGLNATLTARIAPGVDVAVNAKNPPPIGPATIVGVDFRANQSFNDADLARLATLTDLETLQLVFAARYYPEFTPQGREVLRRLTNLRSLSLGRIVPWAKHEPISFITALPRLEVLSVEHLPSNNFMLDVEQVPTLREVTLGSAGGEFDANRVWEGLKKLPALRHVYVPFRPEFYLLDQISERAKQFPHLRISYQTENEGPWKVVEPTVTPRGAPAVAATTPAPPRWPLAPSKPEDVRWLHDVLKATLTLRSGPDKEIVVKHNAPVPTTPATIVGIDAPREVGPKITDEALTRLATLTDLESLRCDLGPPGAAATKVGMVQLAQLVELRSLHLGRVGTADTDYSFLERLPRLENLGLSVLPFPNWVDHVKRIPRLRDLTINQLDLSRLSELKDCPQLAELSVGSGDLQVRRPPAIALAKLMPWLRITLPDFNNKTEIIEPTAPRPDSGQTAVGSGPTIPAEALTFGGHRYLLVDSFGTWSEAKTKAEAIGGHLATINSKEERDWVFENVWRKRANKAVSPGRMFLGATSGGPANSWTWVTGEPLDPSLWLGPVEPGVGLGLTWDGDDDWDGLRLDDRNHRVLYFLVEWDTLGPAVGLANGPTPPLAKAPFDATQAKAYQAAWAKHLGTQVETTNSVGQTMILIPPGEFLMGSTDEQVEAALKVAEEIKADQYTKDRIQKAERPQHKVVITKPLLMSATEVTIGQFKKFVEASKYVTEAEQYGFGDSSAKVVDDKVTELQKQRNWRTPGYAVTDDSPVSQVTWNDACAYCNWLSEQEQRAPSYRPDGTGSWFVTAKGNGYRLPTEAEWEYACRAGTTTQYSFGDDYQELLEYGWYNVNAGGSARAVGLKAANAFGLHDMHGNLQEWCGDFYDEKWYERPSLNDPTGPASGSNRVIRGGNWFIFASHCRSAYRSNYFSPSTRSNYYGFRCVSVW